jgi:ADP-ribose pyrophosphatase YjhB (NUDIX family)
MWTIPSGFMELGESLEDGARREALEEANLTFEIIKLYGNYSIPEIGQVLFVFLVTILNKDYAPMDETSEVHLFKIDNIPWSKIAFPSVEYFLKNYVQDHKSNNFRFHSNFIQKYSNNTI